MQPSFEALKGNFHIVRGTPNTVLEQLKYLHDWPGMEHLIIYCCLFCMSHVPIMANIGLNGKEALPVIKEW